MQIDSPSDIIAFIESVDSSQQPMMILFMDSDSLTSGSTLLDTTTRQKILNDGSLIKIIAGDLHYWFVSKKVFNSSSLTLSKKQIEQYPYVCLGFADSYVNVKISNFDNSHDYQNKISVFYDGYVIVPFDEFYGDDKVKITIGNEFHSETKWVTINWVN